MLPSMISVMWDLFFGKTSASTERRKRSGKSLFRSQVVPFVSVQEFDPVHREVDGAEILFHLSFEEVGPHLVQHEAELVIHFREEDGLIDAGGVLKGDELHGIAGFGLHCLAGDQPANGGDMLAHTCVQVLSPHIVEAFQNILVAIQGMDGEEEAEGLQLMLEHKGFGVGR